MSPLLIAMLGVLLVPLFVATWRMSLIGLGCQGALMALFAWHLHPNPNDAGEWLTFIDLLLIRGIAVPYILYRVLKKRRTPGRSDIIPPNLFSWALAFGFVLVSFTLAEVLVPSAGEQRTLVAVCSSGLMIGFLVLSTQTAPFGQMVGVIRIENAIALLELGVNLHHERFELQLGLVAVFVATVLAFRYFLDRLPPELLSGHEAISTSDGVTL